MTHLLIHLITSSPSCKPCEITSLKWVNSLRFNAPYLRDRNGSALQFFGFPVLVSALGSDRLFLARPLQSPLCGAWLAAASIFFYGYWDYRYLLLLGGSILFNYGAGLRIGHAEGPARKYGLIFAIAVNLLLLGYYKYADFFILSLNGVIDAGIPLLNMALPIGISFFTFTQIAFLVDTYQGKVKEFRFIHFVLFVTYFPHLIAGPVLHHKERMPQFADHRNYRFSTLNLAVGLSIFVMGLTKKLLIADNIAPIANGVFALGAHPPLVEAWVGCWPTRFNSILIFPAIPTWPSACPACLASACR